MAIELKDITSKWMYISIKELKESGFWTKDFEDNPQTYSDEWITKAINLSSVKINDWTGGYIGYADNIDNLTEEQQIGVKWATAIYTLHWLSKGTEYLLQATTFSQGSQSYNIDVPQDMQFVPDEVQKILINAGLYENIRFANLKDNKDKSWFANGDRFEYDYGSTWASYDWVRNNYIANNNITSSDNSILINFINRLDGIPQKLDLKINPNIKVKIDNISIVYNSNNELSVPFDNDTIYNDNGVWKSKQSPVIKIDNKTIIKNNEDELMVSDLKQNKITLLPNSSGRANADFNAETGELRIWDPSFGGGKNTADYDIIDSTVAGIESTDDTFGTTKYLDKFFLQKKDLPKIFNDWEVVDTSDFIPDGSQYFIKDFDRIKYKYKLWAIYKYQQNDTLTTPIETLINYFGAIEWTRYIPTQDNNLIVRINTKYGNISFGNFGKDIIQNIILYRKLVS